MRYSAGRQALLIGSAAAIALCISVLTALAPMYFAVPRIIYANIIPCTLMAVTCGELPAVIYAVVISYILNNVGMGSGVLPNVLIYQIIEAVIIGRFLKDTELTRLRPVDLAKTAAVILFDSVILKALSFALYYFFNMGSMSAGENIFIYTFRNYIYYLSTGLISNIYICVFSFVCAFILKSLILKMLRL